MAIIWGLTTPPAAATYAGAAGDIFVSLGTEAQFRFQLTPSRVWTQIVPSAGVRTTLSDTRADVVPGGGKLNDRLAKSDDTSWALGWANAAEGVVAQIEQTTPAKVWDVTHNLGARFVHVLVISPGQADPTAEQTIEEPDIEFNGAMTCRLTFLEDVAGTVVVRR